MVFEKYLRSYKLKESSLSNGRVTHYYASGGLSIVHTSATVRPLGTLSKEKGISSQLRVSNMSRYDLNG